MNKPVARAGSGGYRGGGSGGGGRPGGGWVRQRPARVGQAGRHLPAGHLTSDRLAQPVRRVPDRRVHDVRVHLPDAGPVQRQDPARAGLRDQLDGDRRRQDLDLPHGSDAKWSDGKPLTAQDAAWTFATILKYQNGPTANSAGYVAHMASAAAPERHTLVLTYKQPVANVLSQVQQVPILPEHVWARYATGNGKGLTTFTKARRSCPAARSSCSSTPRSRSALFKRNPTFYGSSRTSTGSALEFFTNDDAMVTALKSGQLDGVEVGPPNSVSRPQSRPVSSSARRRATRSTTSSSTTTRTRKPATRNC